MPISHESDIQEIPAHLNRWNWGAFLLNWIWGIGNSVWIALLCLIPGVNLIMMFVLGFKGSAWAWRNRLWRDEEHFRKNQRRWAIAGVIVWLALPTLIVVAGISIFGALKNSDPYRMTMAEVRANPAVQASLGEGIEPGFFVMGSIQLNGAEGRANLQVPISGPRGKGTAYSRAVKNAGAWELILLIVRVPNQSEPIVIINKSNLPIPGGPLET